jgi:hypothetical protein
MHYASSGISYQGDSFFMIMYSDKTNASMLLNLQDFLSNLKESQPKLACISILVCKGKRLDWAGFFDK